MILSYVRCSTREQNEGTTIAEQERKNRAVAQLRSADLGYDFLNFADIGVSGTIPLGDRPAGKDLLAMAKRGDTVIGTKLDRLFRSAKDALVTAEAFKKRGIDLILTDLGTEPITQNGVAKIVFGLLAMVAEFERDRMIERLNEGRKAKKAKGGHIAGSAPYGFKVVGRGREAKLEPFEEEIDVARYIRDLSVRRGYGSSVKLTDAVNEMGFRTRLGTEFARVQVRRILKSSRLEQVLNG